MQPEQPQPQPETALAPVQAPAPPPAATGLQRVTVEQLMAFPDADKKAVWISALVEAEVARQNYSQDRALAREFALSGQFDDLKAATAEQAIATAMVKIQLGRAWGFNAADSMRYIYFTNGRPAVENEIVAAKLQQGGYDWDVEWLEAEEQHKGKPWRRCVGCTLWLKKWSQAESRYNPILDRNGKPVSVSFTEGDADHALIWEKGKQIPLSEKWNFKSWGRDMYYWRAVGRVKKYHAPHVLRGGVTREEALDIIPADLTPPPDLPRELRQPDGPPAAERAPAPEAPPKQRLRDKIIGQGSILESLPIEEEPQQ